jgi:hypothetical protein
MVTTEVRWARHAGHDHHLTSSSRGPGAGHTAGLRERPAEYERRVVDFLDRSLLSR